MTQLKISKEINKKELAKKIKVSMRTLYNWEKEKPELIQLINQGMLMDDVVKELEKTANRIKKLKD